MPLGTQGVLGPVSCCLRVWCLRCLVVWFSNSLKGDPPPLSILGRSPVFKHPNYLQRCVPKVFKIGLSKAPKITQICKKRSSKTRSRSRLAKRLSFKGVKPLKLTIVTHFQLFLKRPRALKNDGKWEPKWCLRALKITKIVKREHTKKTAKSQHCKKGVSGCLGGGSSSDLFRPFFKLLDIWGSEGSRDHSRPSFLSISDRFLSVFRSKIPQK